MTLNLPENVNFIIDTLSRHGFAAYAVGGCVRDSFLGITPTDYDVCTSAFPDEIINLFDKTVPTGIKHGTVTVISGGEPVEVTTFRTDGDYKDFRRPDNVDFVSDVKEDLARRDFTVNAICYNDRDGIIDCFGGMNDINSRVLRAVGDPDTRFKEDALRILRLFRFASTLGFSPEEKTFAAAINNAGLLKNVSAERIREELKKLSGGTCPQAVLPLIDTGALPGFSRRDGIEKIPALPNNVRLRFFAMLNLLSDGLKDTLAFLKCSNAFLSYAEKMCAGLTRGIDTRADIKRLLRILESDIFDLLYYREIISGEKVVRARTAAEGILNSGEPYKLSQLAIGGKDISKKGYRGAQISEKLEFLLNAVTENPKLNDRETLNSMI